MAEHRMYLPLAAVAAAAVVGTFLLARRALARTAAGAGGLPNATRRRPSLLGDRVLVPVAVGVGAAAVILAAGALGAATALRNLDYRSEKAILADTVAKRPGNPRAHNGLGVALQAEGDLAGAMARFNEAIELDGAFALAYNNRGILQQGAGRTELALKDYDRAIALGYPDAFCNRGNLHKEAGRLELAIADYNQAVRLRPDLVEAYYNRGLAWTLGGKYAEAVADFDQALRLRPALVDAYVSRASAHGRLGHDRRAVEDCDRALRLKPDFGRAYFTRAVAFYSLKAYDRAWSDVRLAGENGYQVSPVFIKALSEASGRSAVTPEDRTTVRP